MIDRKVFYGVTFVALIVGLIVGTIAIYNGALRQSTPLMVETDRAGLTLASGATVKMRGVQIGRVKEVRSAGDSNAVVELEIQNDLFDRIGQDVTAQIVPPTAFGAKYVQITPGDRGTEAIQAGATISSDAVTVEVDTAFVNLTNVLNAARPAQVNAALTAVAESVDQRGEVLGQLITQTDRYLESFNPSLPDLTEDIKLAEDVAAVYDRARPDIVALAENASVTSDTIVKQQASLRALELSLISFNREAIPLLDSSGDRLATTLDAFEPVTDVLAKYSPELPCTVLGLAATNKLAEAAVGGTNPGVTTITRLVPTREKYTFEENLPRVGDTRGPGCYGLPSVSSEEAAAQPPAFDTGANPYAGPQPAPSEKTVATFFGVLRGLIGAVR